jgi:WD40 repeat protein
MNIYGFLTTLFPNIISNLINEYIRFSAECQKIFILNTDFWNKKYNILSNGRFIRHNCNSVEIWNIEQDTRDVTFKVYSSSLFRDFCCSYDPHNRLCCTVLSDKRIVTVSEDYELKIWTQTETNNIFLEATNNKYLDPCPFSRFGLFYCSILSNGYLVTAAKYNITIRIWKIKKNKIKSNIKVLWDHILTIM